ncbi:MAG: Na+/H+ antiporter NhaD/arsenite permease-like protein [Alphaproteobacteria bacterium]|jgi:Na+/H+ antiporter NhaD/arsenite permease-like protein
MSVEAVADHATISSFQYWTALVLFLATYGIVLTERINRAIVAVLGASLMVLLGVLTQDLALKGVDFNTIGLLLGMMIIVVITKESGVFQYVAIKSAKVVHANPIGVLAVFSIVTAVFSALLDNVTTVLLITPVILLITRELGVKPYPYLFSSILASNIGGSATLIGDPPNIMIGSAANLSFNAFVYNLTPLAIIVMVLTMVPLLLIWRKELVASDHNKERIMKLNEKEAIKDPLLLKKAIFTLLLVILGFTVGHGYHIQPATSAMFGAALLLLLNNFGHNHDDQEKRVHASIAEAEWVTLFFFGGLFVVVYGLEHVGVINQLADMMLEFTAGDFETTVFTVLWGSAIISALVDNIPFVATMIPMIENMSSTFNTEQIGILWWALAIGACLGGNGSLIGASANLVVAGFASRAGHSISFLKFMKLAFPLMLASIAIAHVYIQWRYL